MKTCPICQYALEPFEANCPRCPRNAAKTVAANPSAMGANSASAQRVGPPAPSAPAPAAFSWLPGALLAAVLFLLPGAFFALCSAGLTFDAARGQATFSHVRFTIIVFFAPVLGGLGGYIASTRGWFWQGFAAGAAFGVPWACLCFAIGSGKGSTMFVMATSLFVYEAAAILGGAWRQLARAS